MNVKIEFDEDNNTYWCKLKTETTTGKSGLITTQNNALQESSTETCNSIKLEGQQTINRFSSFENDQVREEYNLDISNEKDDYKLKTLHHNCDIKDEPTDEEIDDKNCFLSCNYCEFKTDHSSNLTLHLNCNHSKQFMYECDFCNNKYVRTYELIQHVNNVHSTEYQKKSDRLKKNPNMNNCKHPRQFTYECDFCDNKYTQTDDLIQHVNNVHSTEYQNKSDRLKKNRNSRPTRNAKQKFNKCDFCDYKTVNLKYLKNHVMSKHATEIIHICKFCDYISGHLDNLKSHIKTRHSFLYKCGYCTYETDRIRDLKQHNDSKHNKQLVYECDLCDCKFSKIIDLVCHVNTTHPNAYKNKAVKKITEKL